MNIELTAPPDRANELAKETLMEVNRLGAMFDGFSDPTACQELALSHAIRKYHVERMGAAHAQNMVEFDEIRTLLEEAKAALIKAMGP